MFLRRGGSICCEVTGLRRYSSGLPQGGLEYSPRLLLSLSELIRALESVTLATSSLAATMADDESDKDNHPVGCISLNLSFTAKYLYNDIDILVNSHLHIRILVGIE